MLSFKEKNDIQNDKKLCCNIIDFAQQLLKQQFPSVNGLQFTGYAPMKTVPLVSWIERTQWSCPVWWICTEGVSLVSSEVNMSIFQNFPVLVRSL
jgi:hypothetical protein